MFRGEVQQPLRLDEILPGLNRNHAIHANTRNLRAQMFRQKIAADGFHRIVNPAVFDRVVIPEMMVRINLHAHPRNAKWRASRPSSFNTRQSAGGISFVALATLGLMATLRGDPEPR